MQRRNDLNVVRGDEVLRMARARRKIRLGCARVSPRLCLSRLQVDLGLPPRITFLYRSLTALVTVGCVGNLRTDGDDGEG